LLIGENMKGFYKTIGNVNEENSLKIESRTFSGGKPVNVFTPKEPTKKEYNETVDFLLGELDDHDAIDEYNELVEKKW